MSTILELKSTIAGILGVTVTDFTVNDIDFGLAALNAVRLQAEQGNDFEFQRKTLSLTVNTLIGGSLEDAVIYGTSTAATIKTLIDVGQADTNGNFVPLEWTTKAESLERTRGENRYGSRALRYPSDADYQVYVGGRRRVVFNGDRVSLFPMGTVSENVTLLFEAYVYSSAWTAYSLLGANGSVIVAGTLTPDVTGTYAKQGTYNAHNFYFNLASSTTPYLLYWSTSIGWRLVAFAPGLDLATPVNYWLQDNFGGSGDIIDTYTPGGGSFTGAMTVTNNDAGYSDIWTTKGANYLIWASVVWLNQNASPFGKQFVTRQEGNLAPPTQLAAEALVALIACDTNKFELFRRHGR